MGFGLCDLEREVAPRKRLEPMHACTQESTGGVNLTNEGMGWGGRALRRRQPLKPKH